MLVSPDRHIISEIRGFFAESDNTKAIQGVMNVMDHIQITQRQTGFAKSENCKFTAEQIFRLAVLFPFFPIKNVRNYTKSMLGQLFMTSGTTPRVCSVSCLCALILVFGPIQTHWSSPKSTKCTQM